jgi:asparagine synthase (glutamine-hydrolysing)
MCGICGIYDLRGNGIDRDLLGRMSERIRHRGPDGEGHFISGPVGLGNRRLSIIDVEGGGQPQSNEDGSLQVVFNGEIYNFVELREELEGKGHRFKTRCDTEVIVHGYEEWGVDCVRRFNGMFAFALWDCGQRRLFLARDHLGIKPLYYVLLGNRFLFASEIKALLVDPECPREVDLRALSELFTLRYVASPGTLFKGIQKLAPGHRVVVQSTGMQITRYWNWTPRVRSEIKEAELIEEYRSLVESAVRLQMRSDVPVGLFLSSGVDSGALLAIMGEFSSRPVHTFTIGFQPGTIGFQSGGFQSGEESNETEHARALAKQFGADHSELTIGPQDFQKYYERYLWDLEEPVGNEAAAAFYFVSLLSREKVKVALTGQGADEPWAGYGRHLGVKLAQLYSRLPKALGKGFLRKVGERWIKNEPLKRGLGSLHERDALARWISIYSIFTPEMRGRLFQPWVKEQISPEGDEARRSLEPLQAHVQDLDALTQILYLDTRTTLPDNLLMVCDKTSMANSLEVRVPFLDTRLIEFAESLPPGLKLRAFRGKYLHKKAMEKWLPRQVVYRKKIGFATPLGKWLRTSMRPFVHECLLSEDAAVNRYFDRKVLQGMCAKHESGQAEHQRHIHLLLAFELWHRQFIS